MKHNNSYIEAIENLLIAAEKKENKINSLLSIIKSIAFLSILFLTAALIELIAKFNTSGRSILFLLLLLFSAVVIVISAVIPLLFKRIKHHSADHVRTAENGGRYYDFIKDDLKNTLQIAYDNNPGFSDELKEAAVKRAAEKYGNINFSESISLKPFYNRIITGLTAILVTAMLFLTVSPLSSAMYRLINFNKDFSSQSKYLFSVKPGNVHISKGDGLEISISVNDRSVTRLELFTMAEDDAGYSARELTINNEGLFKQKINEIKKSFLYYASIEGINSPVYKAEIISYPVLQGFKLKISPPAYSGIKEEYVKDNGNVTALPGSKLLFDIKSSKALKDAAIVVEDSLRIKLNVSSNSASGELILRRDAVYYFSVADQEGYTNNNPVRYSLKAVNDVYPSVQILSPEENINPAGIQKLNLIAGVSDDFGISKLELKYSVSGREDKGGNKIVIPLKAGMKEGEIYYSWDISELYLRGGEVAEYYLEISDNDVISGPKSSRSSLHKITVPTLDEIMKRYDENQESVEKKMNEIIKEAEVLKKETDKNITGLKKEKKELSWEEKNSIAQNARNFEKLLGKMEETEKKLSEFNRKMNEEKLLSKETLDKYQELQDLFKELNNDDMKDAIKKLQDALQNMIRDGVRQPLEKMNVDEENFKSSLERTINLLKQIKVEQKIDEVLKRIEKLKKDAEEIKNKINAGGLDNKESAGELSNRQKEMTKDINKLEEELKSAGQLMKEVPDMPMEEMKKIIEELQSQKNNLLSENSGNAMMQMKKEEALNSTSRLSGNFSALSDKMAGLKKNLLLKNQMKAVSGMMKAMNNLIALSKEQEKIRKELEALQYNPDKLKEKVKPQNDLKNNLLKVTKQIVDLSQTTFGITPELGSALGRALQGMQQAIVVLENSGGNALIPQRNAMEGMNKGAELLKDGIDKMMGGGSGGGASSLMQQLKQIIQKQSDLNMLTKQLNGQDQAGLQRLAQQQDLIRKSLEKLNREAAQSGRSKSIAGNIEKTIDEVKSIVKEMNENKPLSSIVSKQKRILSRMLDSQLSMNEKDYERNRESKSGTEFNLNSPEQLRLKRDSAGITMEELLKAEKEGFSKDYKSLIRRYFEILEKRMKK